MRRNSAFKSRKMASSKLSPWFFLFQALLSLLSPMAAAQNSNLFAEYIGAEFTGVKFSDVPINPDVDFHFILAFAIDYTASSSPTPTNGQFKVFWDTDNLSPSAVSAIKQSNSNVKVALSLGGATVNDAVPVYFTPSSVDSWVSNAVSSLTSIIQQYNLDGIDIDYEKFDASVDPDTFAECIGRLLTTLKNDGVISFASIAPYVDQQSYYQALWGKYSHVIDYVNYQFYGYYANTTVSEFLGYFNEQSTIYDGKKLLASFTTAPSGEFGGLSPENGFFDACKTLQNQGKLPGIFVWAADNSKSNGFQYEKQAEELLANANKSSQ